MLGTGRSWQWQRPQDPSKESTCPTTLQGRKGLTGAVIFIVIWRELGKVFCHSPGSCPHTDPRN